MNKLLNLLFKNITTIAHKITVKSYYLEKRYAGKRVNSLKAKNYKLREAIMSNQKEIDRLETFYRE